MYLTILYIIILLLILLFDMRERRILNALALPGTAIALLAGAANGREAFVAAAAGAALGFFFFFILYRIGGRYFGPAALGFGDVKLAMLLGAVLGVHQVLTVLAAGMLLAGAAAAMMLAVQRGDKQRTLPYGAFLAAAGIAALIWTNFESIPRLAGF